MKKSQKGFTLVELIVVIAIIGVLAAILVPAMVGYIKDSKLSSANSSAKTVYTAINNYAQKSLTAGYPLTANASIAARQVTAPATGDPDPTQNATDLEGQLDLAVGNSLNKDADQSWYKVDINAQGFPEDVAWAKSDVDTYVGAYPTPNEDNTTDTISSYPF